MQQVGVGIVLMVAGMGIVYTFLCVLIVVAKYASAFVSRFDYIFPKDAPKKAPKPAASSDDADVALAIAVALTA